MKRLLPFALIVLAIGSAAVLSGRAGAPLQGVPGTTMGGNIAKAHTGFRFLRAGARQAQVERRSDHQIMGAYECIAPKGGNSTGCNLHVSPTSVECQGTAANGGVCKLRARVTERH